MNCAVTELPLSPSTWPKSLLVIGYGNTYRRDDGAGPVLAEKLLRFWSNQGLFARLVVSIQLEPEMAEEIANHKVDAVVFVDCREQDENGGIQVSSLPQLNVGELNADSATFGHHLDPATVLLYAALLYEQYPRAWLVTIPGTDFGHGQGFSQVVNQLLMDIARPARQLLCEFKELLYA